MTFDTDDSRAFLRERLKALLSRHVPEPGSRTTDVPSLRLHRRDAPCASEFSLSCPVLVVIAQGGGRTLSGGKEYRWEAGQCLAAGVLAPGMSHVAEASPERPFLALSLDLDGPLLARTAATLPDGGGETAGACGVWTADTEFLDTLCRLAALPDTPERMAGLAPLLLQQLYLLLLLGPRGPLLRALVMEGAGNRQVLRGVGWLREHAAEPLNVEAMARRAHMAASTLRRHFKTATGMSPTAYRKHLQIYEARRLMVEEGADAADAAHAVGYESLSRFNRDYQRILGVSPARHSRRSRREEG